MKNEINEDPLAGEVNHTVSFPSAKSALSAVLTLAISLCLVFDCSHDEGFSK